MKSDPKITVKQKSRFLSDIAEILQNLTFPAFDEFSTHCVGNLGGSVFDENATQCVANLSWTHMSESEIHLLQAGGDRA
jgi:hypothetical protein